MSDESWEERFKQFLSKTGDDFRRAGEDIKAEAQKLLDAAMDAEKQQKVRDRMSELGAWARSAAQGVAGAMEGAASKAGSAFHSASEKVAEAKEKVVRRVARKPAAGPKKASGAKARPGKARGKGSAKRKR